MLRLAATAFLGSVALAATGCGSTRHPAAPTGSTPSATPGTPAGCVSQQTAGIVADFGHRRTAAAATQLATRAEHYGFKGLRVEQRGCTDFAVVLRGLTSTAEGRSLQAEAKQVGLHVTLDCRSAPAEGGLAAVFGHRRTAARASALAARAARLGFRGLHVVEVGCDDWAVLLYGLKTPGERRAFAKEAAAAGFHIRYEPG